MGVSNTVQQLSVLENREGRLKSIRCTPSRKSKCEYQHWSLCDI